MKNNLLAELHRLDKWSDSHPPATWQGNYQYVVDLYGELCSAKIAIRRAVYLHRHPTAMTPDELLDFAMRFVEK